MTDETQKRDSSEHEPALDGLRAWQAAVVRLWSASEDAFAELTIQWVPEDDGSGSRTPWSARLLCGDSGKPGWSEDVRISSAASIQQALQRLWDRAKVRHGLFKDDPSLTVKLPSDFPSDLWLNIGERALLDRAMRAIQASHTSLAFRLGYYPERRLRQRWTALVHRIGVEPPDGVIREVSAANLLNALDELLAALAGPAPQEQKADLPGPETRALAERKVDTSIIAKPSDMPPDVQKPT
ncbi:MAG: hypothetical protein ACYDBJ_22950 [Aggregatilineales bacterium]